MIHLTKIPHSTHLASHPTEDLQAVRIACLDHLYVNGRRAALTGAHHTPTQIVINSVASGLTAADLESELPF